VKTLPNRLPPQIAGDNFAKSDLKYRYPFMKTPWFATLVLIGTASMAAAADITGKVVLKGTPPAEITIDMSTSPDKICGAAHSKPVTTRHYVVGKDGGLANVLVYVKSGLEGKTFPAPATESTMLDQIGCIYEPYVMGVMVNQKFKIKNSDPTMHNVHATPKVNKEFNFAQPIKDQTSERSFDKPEVPVRFMCNVHAWMFAYVGVFDHPFFAVTDKDGNFKISGLPNGKYTLVAYHVKTHRDTPGVSSEANVSGDTKVDFTIELK
jgi:hypothetical protein